MTDLALTVPSSPAPVPSTRWLDLETAARLSGISVGHLRRKCGADWASQGLARTNNDTPGRKPFWEISELADASFRLSKAGEPKAIVQVRADSMATAGKGGAKARFKAAILARWEERLRAAVIMNISANDATTGFLHELQQEFGDEAPKRSALYDWKNKASEGGGVDGHHRSYRHPIA